MSIENDYSVRRALGGSWLMGDRWEVLWRGRNWLYAPSQYLPVGSASQALTRRGAVRKARRLARLRLDAEAQTISGLPLDDLRSHA